MSPVPQPKINSLIEQQSAVIAEFTNSFQLDAVTCKRLENEFEELAKLPELEVDCYIALATLCALKRKHNDALHFFSKIRKLGLWSHTTSLHFAVCSIYCGDVLAAAKEIQDLPIKGDPDYLRQLRAICVRVGLFRMAGQCTAQLVALDVDENARDALLSREAAITEELIATSGINPQEVVERIHVAHAVVAQYSYAPIVAYGLTATFDGALYKFPLNLNTDELAELEWKIDEALVDSFETFIPGVISFTCRSAPSRRAPTTREM